MQIYLFDSNTSIDSVILSALFAPCSFLILIGSLCRNIAPSIRELSAKLNQLHIETKTCAVQPQTPNKQIRNRSNVLSEIEDKNKTLQDMHSQSGIQG